MRLLLNTVGREKSIFFEAKPENNVEFAPLQEQLEDKTFTAFFIELLEYKKISIKVMKTSARVLKLNAVKYKKPGICMYE